MFFWCGPGDRQIPAVGPSANSAVMCSSGDAVKEGLCVIFATSAAAPSAVLFGSSRSPCLPALHLSPLREVMTSTSLLSPDVSDSSSRVVSGNGSLPCCWIPSEGPWLLLGSGSGPAFPGGLSGGPKEVGLPTGFSEPGRSFPHGTSSELLFLVREVCSLFSSGNVCLWFDCRFVGLHLYCRSAYLFRHCGPCCQQEHRWLFGGRGSLQLRGSACHCAGA